ncbi:MAG TPA: TetR/AcrR family transcriptional regulator [Ignavibacteria bacterium]|jgi:AcrR family transcriptional regulator
MRIEAADTSEEKLRILLYARERFFKEGFAKITVDEIARELEMSKSTLYKYFKNKDELIQQTIISVIHEVSARVKMILEADSNAIEKFRGLIAILTRNIIRFTDKFLHDMQVHTPHIWEEIDEIRKRLMNENISKIIRQGQKEKLFIDYPPEIIINLIIGAMRNIVNPQFLLYNRFSIDQAAKTGFSILINGILTEKGKKVYKQLKF